MVNRARFVVVSAVFPPEPVVSARTSADIAEELASRGHAVRAIAPFPSRPAGRLYEGYSRRLTGRTEQGVSGVEVERCWSTFSRRSTMASRFAENLTFGVTAAIALLLARRADAIYSNTWGLFATGLVAAVALLRRIPLVIAVQDLYPESLVSQSRLAADSVWIRVLFRLDGWIASTARFVLLPGMIAAERYAASRSIPGERVRVIPNWSNLELEVSAEAAAQFRRQKAIPQDLFLLVYCGNVGAAAGVERVIGLLGALPAAARVGLLVAGEGSRLGRCERMAPQIPGGRVWFHHPFPDSDTAAVLGSADLCVLPTHGDQSAASAPSKLIAYMLAGKAVIAMAREDSDTAATLRDSGCGWLVAPDAEQEFVRLVGDVRGLPPAEIRARGEAGRAYARRHLVRAAGAPRVADVIEDAGGFERSNG